MFGNRELSQITPKTKTPQPPKKQTKGGGDNLAHACIYNMLHFVLVLYIGQNELLLH